jgi:uncharacterized membrane protein
MENEIQFDGDDIERNHDLAAFSWTLIFSAPLLIFRRESNFIQFHARQAFVLFVFAVIISQFPAPFSNLNILTLAVAVVGFLKANFKEVWRAPLLFEIAEKGFSPGQLIFYARQFYFSAVNFVRRVFKKSPVQFSAVFQNPLAQSSTKISERINFLESQLLIERFLHGKTAREISAETKLEIKKAREFFAGKKVDETDAVDFLHFKFKNREVFVGNFSDESCELWANFDFSNSNLNFGSFRGVKINFENSAETEKTFANAGKVFAG